MVGVRFRGSGSSMGWIKRTEMARRFGGHLGRIDRSDLLENLEHMRRGKRHLAGAQFIQNHAQREDVAGEGGRLAASLLGRQVTGRAEHALARFGHGQFAGVFGIDRPQPAQPPSQAEIEDLDHAVGR